MVEFKLERSTEEQGEKVNSFLRAVRSLIDTMNVKSEIAIPALIQYGIYGLIDNGFSQDDLNVILREMWMHARNQYEKNNGPANQTNTIKSKD